MLLTAVMTSGTEVVTTPDHGGPAENLDAPVRARPARESAAEKYLSPEFPPNTISTDPARTTPEALEFWDDDRLTCGNAANPGRVRVEFRCYYDI